MDELGASQERYRALVELSPDAIAVIQDGLFVFANQQALRLAGARDLQQLREHPASDRVPAVLREPLTRRYGKLSPGARLPYIEGRLIRLDDGAEVPIETAAAGIEFEGRPAVMIVVRDITARHESEQATWAAEQRFAAAFHEAPVAMLLLDPSGVILDANPALGGLVSNAPRTLLGRQSLRLVHREDRNAVRGLLRSAADKELADRNEIADTLEWRFTRPDGQEIWVQGSVAPLPGEPRTLVVHLIDVTERRANDERLAHQALHDPLTGLPNRALLTDRLSLAVRAVSRDQGGVAVLYLDLDGFKHINDSHGHATGDQVLVEVARRLRSAVRPADTVARLGGDEYAIVAEGLPAPDALALAQRVRRALKPPIGDLSVTVSVGTAHSSQVGLDADALLRQADADMYGVKRRRRRMTRASAGEPAARSAPDAADDQPTDAA